MNTEANDALIACIPRLRRYARALTGSRSDADDLVQDTVERGWSRLSLWRHGSDMRAWLFSIMHNLHADRFRRTQPVLEELDDDMPQHSVPAPALDMRDLESCLRRLPDEQREVLLLVALEDMRYEDVATTLGIPVGTVMSRLSRGREKLRLLMEGQPQGTPLKVIK
ncbi:MAG TPA: RNA polymerase sigma factor [Burkholderiaceae bacterium]